METITLEYVNPGDVLLYAGTSFISRGIQVFDGTWASHAAVYMGDGRVGEAVSNGLVPRDIHDSYASSEWVEVRRLKETVPTMNPVLWTAEEYLGDGNRYGYEQLLLLAFLCITRKLPMTPKLRMLMRVALDAGATLLTRLLSVNREPMICSEFAYRVYDEALPESNDVYSIRVNQPLRALEGVADGRELGHGRGGGGIHPQSWLALLSDSASDIWIPAEGEGAPVSEALEPVANVEALSTAYLQEIRGQAGPLGQEDLIASVSLGELRAATDRFAVALFEARQLHEPFVADELSILSTRSAAYRYLFETAADFVTPGDLVQTPSLYPVGRLQL